MGREDIVVRGESLSASEVGDLVTKLMMKWLWAECLST